MQAAALATEHVVVDAANVHFRVVWLNLFQIDIKRNVTLVFRDPCNLVPVLHHVEAQKPLSTIHGITSTQFSNPPADSASRSIT